MYRNKITIPDEREEIEKNRIARMIYRNDESMLKHERVVIQLEDFIGAMAGVYDLLLSFFGFLFGNYIDFIGRIKWVRKRYKFRNCNQKEA